MSIEPAPAALPIPAADSLQQLEAALRRQAILREVLEALASEPDLDALLHLVVGHITQAMDADRSSLFCSTPRTISSGRASPRAPHAGDPSAAG